MTDVRLYFGIERLPAMTDNQRDTLADALRQLGQANGGLPHLRNHWRIRSDNDAVIFEALFDDNTLTIAAFKARLASIFGVTVASINHALVTASFGSGTTQVVTFSRLGTNYLRVAVFGGVTATWEQSRQETLAYLAANQAAWDAAS